MTNKAMPKSFKPVSLFISLLLFPYNGHFGDSGITIF